MLPSSSSMLPSSSSMLPSSSVTLISSSSAALPTSSSSRFSYTSSASASSSSTSATASPTPSHPVDPSPKKNNAGTIAGAVVGGVVGLALIGAALAFLYRRHKRHNKPIKNEMATAPTPSASVKPMNNDYMIDADATDNDFLTRHQQQTGYPSVAAAGAGAALGAAGSATNDDALASPYYAPATYPTEHGVAYATDNNYYAPADGNGYYDGQQPHQYVNDDYYNNNYYANEGYPNDTNYNDHSLYPMPVPGNENNYSDSHRYETAPSPHERYYGYPQQQQQQQHFMSSNQSEAGYLSHASGSAMTDNLGNKPNVKDDDNGAFTTKPNAL
ncbi:hypothetical protein BDF20DRAFT_889780 [Mycotypha africana]|uniref:uncharacterized protein n=1 Tax=Mycotypha africana TaxID=64632 RepID=UPI0023011F25|nr:uncharacterized protein BDF20DRAFT_889780 [Mycotypha africana]KAI8970188.1 hypothetical protein BDF20DRAFT_889780 [Mycotypha africana]